MASIHRSRAPSEEKVLLPAEKAAPAKKTTAKKAAAKKTAGGARPRTTAKRTAATRNTGPVGTGAEPAPEVSEKAASVPGRRTTGATSETVLAVLADAQGPLRARELTARLGIGESADNVKAVRTMLERLAKAGRAQRPGRGLYAKLEG
ncbi:type IV toxin-antitoxin system AbiEi family antitoxin domain-containing protein [Kitasatospora sp. NPDC085464]|uniref:type IV toxin-antitoxin system AbiEi family antitoxin domain-containing protein n=1 Tax=Kitasatospora sp. NPDC085464 TaxID=3364063 RepID=UPI0037C5F680